MWNAACTHIIHHSFVCKSSVTALHKKDKSNIKHSWDFQLLNRSKQNSFYSGLEDGQSWRLSNTRKTGPDFRRHWLVAPAEGLSLSFSEFLLADVEPTRQGCTLVLTTERLEDTHRFLKNSLLWAKGSKDPRTWLWSCFLVLVRTGAAASGWNAAALRKG